MPPFVESPHQYCLCIHLSHISTVKTEVMWTLKEGGTGLEQDSAFVRTAKASENKRTDV